MAKPTTIALSPEALAALKKRYGSGLTAQEYLPGARFVSQGKVQEMAASGPQARVQKYRELVAKTGLSQGEEDVKLTMSLFGTPEEYAADQKRTAAIDASIASGAAQARKEQGFLDSEHRGAETEWARAGHERAKAALDVARRDLQGLVQAEDTQASLARLKKNRQARIAETDLAEVRDILGGYLSRSGS